MVKRSQYLMYSNMGFDMHLILLILTGKTQGKNRDMEIMPQKIEFKENYGRKKRTEFLINQKITLGLSKVMQISNKPAK